MRRLLASVMGLMLLGGTVQAQAEPILVTANEAVPPKSWNDEKGDPHGFAVDVAVAVLKDAGYEPSVELYPFPRALERVRNGEAILTGTFNTPERREFLEFSVPLFTDDVLLVVKKGSEFPFNSMEDLRGKRIAYQDRATYSPDFERAQQEVIIAEPDSDPPARLRKLAAGRLDAAVINPGLGALRMHADTAGIDISEFVVLERRIAQPTIHMAIAKGPDSAEKMAKINESIEKLKADGTIERLMAAYY